VPRDDAIETFTITRTQELELPRQVDVIYCQPHGGLSGWHTVIAAANRRKRWIMPTVNLPIVLSDQEAKVVADVTLYNVWVGRVQYQFTVPPKYALLEPTDVITVTKDGASYVMRINSTKLVRMGCRSSRRWRKMCHPMISTIPAGTGTPNIQPPTSISSHAAGTARPACISYRCGDGCVFALWRGGFGWRLDRFGGLPFG